MKFYPLLLLLLIGVLTIGFLLTRENGQPVGAVNKMAQEPTPIPQKNLGNYADGENLNTIQGFLGAANRMNCDQDPAQCTTPSPQTEPSIDSRKQIVCYLDKDGVFEMPYAECLHKSKIDSDGFKQRALQLCLDGKSPLFKEQGTREEREPICNKVFSQQPIPIGIMN